MRRVTRKHVSKQIHTDLSLSPKHTKPQPQAQEQAQAQAQAQAQTQAQAQAHTKNWSERE